MGAGHRRRTISKVMRSNLINDHDVLEVLLYRACPRKDMNGNATALLAAFGSLNNVLVAGVDRLSAVDGIGENVAEYIRIVSMGVSRVSGAHSFGFARSTAEFYRVVQSQNKGLSRDLLELYAIDRDGRVRMVIPVRRQERNKQSVLKKLLPLKVSGVFALRCNGGDEADGEEEELVNLLREACATANVKLYDYCIMQKGGYYSYFVNEKISGDRV